MRQREASLHSGGWVRRGEWEVDPRKKLSGSFLRRGPHLAISSMSVGDGTYSWISSFLNVSRSPRRKRKQRRAYGRASYRFFFTRRKQEERRQWAQPFLGPRALPLTLCPKRANPRAVFKWGVLCGPPEGGGVGSRSWHYHKVAYVGLGLDSREQEEVRVSLGMAQSQNLSLRSGTYQWCGLV